MHTYTTITSLTEQKNIVDENVHGMKIADVTPHQIVQYLP